MNYRISEFAGLFRLSRERIRYYEKIGLLPAPLRAENGYRTYSDADADRLFFILLAKRHGFTLSEIKGQLLALFEEPTECDAGRYQGVIRKKIAQVDADMERLNRVKALLLDVNAALITGRGDPCAALEHYIHTQKPLDTGV
jgi:DNA-binding transcriptional MerR regulator